MMEQFEDRARVEEYLVLLKKYCSSQSDKDKISDVFKTDEYRPSLPSFYQKIGKADKALEAIKWWQKLPQAEKERYDR